MIHIYSSAMFSPFGGIALEMIPKSGEIGLLFWST